MVNAFMCPKNNTRCRHQQGTSRTHLLRRGRHAASPAPALQTQQQRRLQRPRRRRRRCSSTADRRRYCCRRVQLCCCAQHAVHCQLSTVSSPIFAIKPPEAAAVMSSKVVNAFLSTA